MKYIRKYLYLVLCTIVLFLIAIYVFTKGQTHLPSFMIQTPYGTASEEVSIFDADDGNYYVFLPSYADMDQVDISLNSQKKVTIGNVPIYDNMDCGQFDLELPYEVSIDGHQVATIWFYQSKNVAAVYIDTVSGSVAAIHDNKNHEEYATVTLYTADGKINYLDARSILKGRGNATWEQEKRPYSLSLSADGDLLNMGAAKNWVLLANSFDETNLNNKLVLDMASRVGVEWVPESQWVDLYLNGEYNGLYLLTEKVEAHESRLNIDTASGDFLCKIDLGERWGILDNSLENSFLSAAGRTVEITSPKMLSKAETENITQLVNQMEQEILTGKDLSNSYFIDLDSWVRRYIVDEIAGNIDSDLASSYFYFSDGICFAGPIWDYDRALGNSNRNQEPCAFIAKSSQKIKWDRASYYGALYANASFYRRMQEIYITEFKPVIQQVIDQEIDELSNRIRNAAQMNSLRWRRMFDRLKNEAGSVHTQIEIREYLSHRMDFLDRAWLDNIDYCTVQFELSTEIGYWNISVQKGSCLETTYMDIVSTNWIDTATGQVVDFGQPILTDMILSKDVSGYEEAVSPENTLATREYITFLSVAVLFILLIVFMIVDANNRRKERIRANERTESKISS